MRPHQWVKNLFVLLPLVFARVLDQPNLVAMGLLAFGAFCAVSSCIYLINDLKDREKDRLHPVKKKRPLAARTLAPSTALAAAVVLALAAAGTAIVLDLDFLLILVVYLLLNLTYTFWLKRIVIFDVMAISAGYLLRVLAGAVAVDVVVSQWLLLCTGSLALFLAFSKRRHELALLEGASASRDVLSHYGATFLDQMINVVTASTLITYVFYTRDTQTIEKLGTDKLWLTIPFVLFGIFRYLYLLYQVESDRGPTEALLFDRQFVANLALWAASVLAVLYL